MLSLDIDTLAKTVLQLKRARKLEQALTVLNDAIPDEGGPLPTALKKAELLYDLGATACAFALYDRLIADPSDPCDNSSHPDNPNSPNHRDDVRYAYARRLYNKGLGKDAQLILRGISDEALTRHTNYLAKINHICNLLEDLEQAPIPLGTNTRILAMKHAILSFRDRPVRPSPIGRLGRVSLCTGCLGGGGAERQISRLAIALTRHYQDQQPIAGLTVDQPVELIIRSLAPELKQDFFLKEVRDAKVDVLEIAKNEDNVFDDRSVECPTLRLLLSHLPPHCHYGVKHLVGHFTQRQTDYLSVWQDGACLMVGLAALLAGVPRIQLGLRGLPPVERQHLFKPEYEPLYRALAQVPGVDFMSNNQCVAARYADWLQLDAHQFQVVYNGVPPPAVEASLAVSAKIWRQFDERTQDAETTLGGVFRFVCDKSPFVWIDFAAEYLQRHPASRFILVGDGELRAQAQQRAETLGVLERILFVGVSRDVGYWLQKMDALMLFSRYEGLPNVLIEAQMVGVPVISTPAGGAAECVIEGVSGHILDDAQAVNLKQACRYAESMVTSWRHKTGFCEQTHAFLQARFSVDNMVCAFVKTMTLPRP